MRSHHNEHMDTLPTVDVTALKHVAYVIDALIYYLRSGPDNEEAPAKRKQTEGVVTGGADDEPPRFNPWHVADDSAVMDPQSIADSITSRSLTSEIDDVIRHSVAMEMDTLDDQEATNASLASDVTAAGATTMTSSAAAASGRKHRFFQRSNSTTLLGCATPDPFTIPLERALPLAERPHLLTPNARKEDIFGMPRRTVSSQDGSVTSSRFEELPTSSAFSTRANPFAMTSELYARNTAERESIQEEVEETEDVQEEREDAVGDEQEEALNLSNIPLPQDE